MAGRPQRPLDPTAGPVARFAAELRKLRAEAGSPTYRVMARRTEQGASTLSQAAAGDRLPTLSVALAYVAACGGDAGEWEERWREVAAESAAELHTREENAEPPYRGLARLEPADAGLFFGRDQLTDRLLELTGSRRFTAVFGPSGSGKSSLLRAGLIARLRDPDHDGPLPAALRILAPGDQPLRTHAEYLTPADADGDTWLIVDQFEELFTLCTDRPEREQFIDRLLAATEPGSRLRVVIAVRADFLGRCAEHASLSAALQDATVLVGPMSRDEVREAVIKPAQTAGAIVERALTARILDEIDGEPGALPLLSHALLETWHRRKGRALTQAAYDAAGGIHGAIARTAEDVHAGLTPAQAFLARRILLRLITPGEGAPDTRRPARREEFDFGDPADTTTVLDRLARARLVTLDEDRVDIAHEALIAAWPRLRQWIDDTRERLRLHRQLTDAARTWNDLDRDPGALFRGTRLTAAEEGFAGRRAELTAAERAFLDASSAARAQEQHAARRTVLRLRRLRVGVSAAAVVAMIAGLVAWQWNHTGQQRLAQATSRRVAALADSMRYAEPLTALRLSVAAWRISPTLEARSALMGASTQPEQDAFAEPGEAANDALDPFFLKSDGTTLVTGSTGRVQLWDLNTHRLVRTLHIGPNDHLLDVSPDGQRLLILTAKGWEVHDAVSGVSTRLPFTFSDGRVRFGPTPDTFLLQDEDGRLVRVWHRSRPGRTLPFTPVPPQRTTACTQTGDLLVWDGSEQRRLSSTGSLASVARLACGRRDDVVRPQVLHSDPDHLVIATHKRVRVWNLRTGQETPSIPAQSPTSVSSTPDGGFLTVADERALAVWRVASPDRPVFRYALNGRRARSVTLDPRRKTIRYVEGSFLTTPVIRSLYVGDALNHDWRSDTDQKMPPAPDPSGPEGSRVTAVHAAPGDQGRVATGDDTGWVTLWDRSAQHRLGVFDALPPATEDAKPQPVTALAYSPDGSVLAAAGGGIIRLWDAATSRPLGARLLAAGDETVSLAFNRAGTALIADGTHTPPRAYPISPPSVAASVCTRAGSGLSPADWQKYIPDVPYRQTC